MDKFTPTGTSNPSYQIDGSKEVFERLEQSMLTANSGFVNASIMRYMLTCNLIQFHCPATEPVVLDFGCGCASFKAAWDTNYYLPGKKTLDYTGLEITDAYVDAGSRKGHKIRHFDANNHDVRMLDLPCDPDVVLMQQFIEHIDESALDYLLDYTHEVLKDNGMLIVSAPNPTTGKILEDYHDHEYTISEITEKLSQHGFTIVRKFGWLGFGKPNYDALSTVEKEIHGKLRFISDGYANSVMCMVNFDFAPYYYLVLKKND